MLNGYWRPVSQHLTSQEKVRIDIFFFAFSLKKTPKAASVVKNRPNKYVPLLT